MTYTLNGVGTSLCGSRPITNEEKEEWSTELPLKPYHAHPEFYIATESFVIFWVPIIPLKTFVYHHVDRDKYVPSYYPAGEGKVYWPHVKSSISFYILPCLLLLWIGLSLFTILSAAMG